MLRPPEEERNAERYICGVCSRPVRQSLPAVDGGAAPGALRGTSAVQALRSIPWVSTRDAARGPKATLRVSAERMEARGRRLRQRGAITATTTAAANARALGNVT